MDSLVANDTAPPPLQYVLVQSNQDGWQHFRAVHAVSGAAISCRTWADLVSSHIILGSEFSSFLRELKLGGMLLECRGCRCKNGSSTPFEFAVGPAPPLDNIKKADPKPFYNYLFGTGDDDSDQDDVSWASDSDDVWLQETRKNDSKSESTSHFESNDDNSSSSSESSNDDENLIGCAFKNLGGDATLVAPRPSSEVTASDSRFAHLANYVKLTTLREAGMFWALVAIEYEAMLTEHADSEKSIYLSTNGLGVSFLHVRLEHRPKYYSYRAFSQSENRLAEALADDSIRLRIQIASDLHTEFYGLEATRFPRHLIIPRAPVLALLGDIGNACTDSLRSFLHFQADQFEKVLFIFGNHELYNVRNRTKSVTEQWEWMRNVCRERDNIHLLEKDSMDLCGIRILGTSLWSDIPEDMLQDAEMALNDYNLSYNHAEGESPRQLTAEETRDWYLENLAWLRGELDKARQEGVPTLVLTHHTPQLEGTSHPKYAGDPLTCCFSSDLTELLTFPIKVWACGHTHYNFDIDIAGTRLVSNQRGYKGDAKSDYRKDGLVLDLHPVSL